MNRLIELYHKLVAFYRNRDERQRKSVIFALVMALVLCVVMFPSWSTLQHIFGSAPRPQPRKPPALVVPAHPVPSVVAPPPLRPLTPPPAAVPVSDTQWLGVWQGEAALPSRGGVCHLKLELREPDPALGRITGYLSMLCAHGVPGRRPTFADSAMAATGRLNPVSAILSGAPQDGALKLDVEKNLGVTETGRGCAITSFTATRFGNQLATEWHDSVCGDGQIMLRKTAP